MTPVRPLVWRFVGAGFVVASLGFVVARLVEDWDEIRSSASQVSIWLLVVGFVAGIAGLGFTALAWRALLSGLGHPLAVVAASQVFFVSQVGKYLPGSVWPYLAQMRLARDFDVPASRTAQAGLTFVLLHLVTGLVLGIPRLVVGEELDRRFILAVWAIPLLLLLVHPRVVASLTRIAGRVMRVRLEPTRMPTRSLTVAVALLSGAWLFYGVSLAALVAPFEGVTATNAGLLVSSYALAWSVGFIGAALVVVAAPAGLGFREIALYATLAGVMPSGAAALVVLLSRVLMTAADVGWAVVAAGSAGMRRKRVESGSG